MIIEKLKKLQNNFGTGEKMYHGNYLKDKHTKSIAFPNTKNTQLETVLNI